MPTKKTKECPVCGYSYDPDKNERCPDCNGDIDYFNSDQFSEDRDEKQQTRRQNLTSAYICAMNK